MSCDNVRKRATRSTISRTRNGIFFQAEDGIRSLYVTGVQTCALPIFRDLLRPLDRRPLVGHAHLGGGLELRLRVRVRLRVDDHRSEERRVGKECRARRWAVSQDNSAADLPGRFACELCPATTSGSALPVQRSQEQETVFFFKQKTAYDLST